MQAETKLQELKQRLQEIRDLSHASYVLNWDMETYMPPGGAEARGRALSTLARLEHERSTAVELGRLLDDLQPYADSLDPDHDDAALIRVTRREYERNVRVPADFVAKISEHASNLYNLWTQARPANDFARVRDPLRRTLDYSREMAEFFAPYDHIADPLIDLSDYGMKAASVREVFADLRAGLVPIVRAITSQPPADDSCLRLHYPEAEQLAFGLQVARDYGYDFSRGRQDKAPHPFMIRFSLGDIRITTRVQEHYLGDALFSTLHEAGHAMYEQGISRAYEGTPLASGTSSGVHESQSRLWENIIGRSLPFWQHYYPKLQAQFPEQLGGTSLEAFYRAVNKVEPSLIRTDADEVTYNLHVMIRFELEMQMLEGKLDVADLPEAWNAAYQHDLGITPPDDKDGCLQDIHWYGGMIGGAFQGYTLGNLFSAQVFEAATAAHPEILTHIGQGEFETLRQWLTENIYQYGSKYTAPEIIQRISGGLQSEPLIRYLRNKYGALYQLS
jgi:carboxypeptidase Taq